MKSMLLALAIVLIVMAQASTALPATTGDPPGTVEKNVVRWNLSGQYGRIWQTLHPAYQKVVSRSFWQSCKVAHASNNPGVDVLDVKVTDTYADTLSFPLLGRLHVTAVTASIKFKYLGATHTAADTVYYVKVGGDWKGLWDMATYKAYKGHRCPA